MQKISLFVLLFIFTAYMCIAQEQTEKKRVWYTTNGGDAALVSFSDVSRNGTRLNNVPRLTFFLNSGTNLNKDFSDYVGFFTGYNGKNLGIIYDENDSVRYKRRVLLLGIPVGFKFGNLKKGNFFYFGGQADFAFNYKEKRFLNGDKVEKSSEWFSKKTPIFMPSVFAGFRTSGKVGLKAQYFPNNFFNRDYETNGNRPFAGMESTVFFITLSYDFSVREFLNGNMN